MNREEKIRWGIMKIRKKYTCTCKYKVICDYNTPVLVTFVFHLLQAANLA